MAFLGDPPVDDGPAVAATGRKHTEGGHGRLPEMDFHRSDSVTHKTGGAVVFSATYAISDSSYSRDRASRSRAQGGGEEDEPGARALHCPLHALEGMEFDSSFGHGSWSLAFRRFILN